MEHAVVLDKEQNFAKALCRHLQKRFPRLMWSAMTSLKDLYAFMGSLSPRPRAILYSPEQFPDWVPTWDCDRLILREQPLYQDVFHVSIPELVSIQEISEDSTHEVYRLDTKKIERELDTILGLNLLNNSVFKMSKRKLHVFVSDLARRDLALYLAEVLGNNFREGLRTIILPFTKHVDKSSLAAKLSTPSDGSDVRSLLKRLSKEVLQAEQLFPYLFPTSKPGVLSFVPANTVWHDAELSIVAVRQLIALLKTIIRKDSNNDCGLILCDKSTPKLLRQVLPICDALFLLNNAQAFRNPAFYRQTEELKSILPPGFPIQERCVGEIK